MHSSQYHALHTLVVDDDDFMCSLVSATLKRVGVQQIETATSGAAGLLTLDRPDAAIDIILLDLKMPEMDGIEFLRHLSERDYQGGLILFSGADSNVLRAAVNVAKARFLNVLGSLQKPVKAEALAQLLTTYDCIYRDQCPQSHVWFVQKQELLKGLKSNCLQMFYQPQIDIRTGDLVGVEALARWQHPQKGLLGPAAFVPTSEQDDLVRPFTEKVLALTIADMADWQHRQPSFSVAINVSSAALTKFDLPAYVESLYTLHQVNPANITLEITETHLGQDMLSIIEVLTRMKLKQVNLSIDDFGTGYSSLERLKHVPFDELKIDGSFVHGASNDPAAHAIFRSSAELAQQLNLSIVAEGVETPEDWYLTESLNCHIAQGYFIAKPMARPVFEQWLDEWRGLESLPLKPS